MKKILLLSLFVSNFASAQTHPMHALEQYVLDNPSYYPQYDFLRKDDPDRLFLQAYADHGTHVRRVVDGITKMTMCGAAYVSVAKHTGVRPAKRVVSNCDFWMNYFNQPKDLNQAPIARDICGNVAHWPSWSDSSIPYPLSIGRIAYCTIHHDAAVQAELNLTEDLEYCRGKLLKLEKQPNNKKEKVNG